MGKTFKITIRTRAHKKQQICSVCQYVCVAETIRNVINKKRGRQKDIHSFSN